MTARVLSWEQAVRVALHAFVRQDGRLDMQELADELSVSRATLYRVVGSRDKLLGEVIWTLGQRTMDLAMAATETNGVDRIIDTARYFNEQVVSFKPLRSFLHTEPQTALRVLFTPAGRVHDRAVGWWRELFEKAEATGEVKLPFGADDLAYVFVRIGESMLYSDLLAGRDPDIDLTARVERLLFSGS